jgi:uncharacterized membrane protein YvbJ
LKKQPPQFFCDNCGYEVGHNEKACPHCGRLFISVRCPICDYSGEEKRFANGCPLCGYSDPSFGKRKPPKIKKKKQRQQYQAEPLPSWAYIFLAIALIFMILLLSHIITL